MAISNRFQPPDSERPIADSLGEISDVVDQLAVLAQYKPSQDAVVSAVAGDFKRLAPRATGQNVVIPTADGSNFGKAITLFVENSLGVCRIRPVSGTINGATSFSLAAGFTSWLQFVSNGNGKWATTRAGGFPTAGNALSYTGDTLNYIGSPSTINVTPTAGALGVVNISTLLCGGVLTFQAVTEATIAGFTAKPDGFWFILHNRDATTADVIKLLEDSGSTTTSIRTPDLRDLRLYKNDAVMLIYSNSRWRAVAWMPRLFLTGVLAPTWAAQQNDLARGSAGQNVIRVTLTGDQTLTGVVPDSSTNGSPNGELLCIDNVDATDVLTIASESTSSAAANRFQMWDGVSYQMKPRESLWFRYDDTNNRWRPLGSNPHGRLLRSTVLTTGTAATHTLLSSTTTFLVRGVGGGAASGGAAAAAGSLGSGGGSATYGEKLFTAVAGVLACTYTVGAAGTGVSGAAGNNGTASTFAYNAVTSTFPAGSGGTTLAGAATMAVQSGGLGGGAATNTDWFTAGERGDYGIRPGAATAPMAGGKGGSTPWGIGGSPGVVAAVLGTLSNGAAGGGPGAGGGGQANGATTTASAGQNGFAGQFIVEEYS